MKKILAILIIIIFSGLSLPVSAQFLDSNAAGRLQNNTDIVRQGAGWDPNLTLAGTIALIIKAFLGLLGIIFIVLILIAGFNWMTAAGEEEKIKKATSTIRAAIIGLLIIVAAYAITYFVFANLPGGSGSGMTPPG